MKAVKFLLFDCMETLIDMHEIPRSSEYALWAFEGSGNEKYWDGFESYYIDYNNAKAVLEKKYQDNQEYNLLERYDLIVKNIVIDEDETTDDVIDRFFRTFWKRYKKECYVRDEVYNALKDLSKNFDMGVVSNFLVSGGIEELLEHLGISIFFKFKVVSVEIGWKKPSQEIYHQAIEQTGEKAEDILFVGDDFQCDYIWPKKIGMRSILLDRYGKHSDIKERIRNFEELTEIVKSEI